MCYVHYVRDDTVTTWPPGALRSEIQLRMQRRLAEYRGVVVTLNESRVVVYDHSTSYYVVPRDTLERAEERTEEEQRPAKRMCSA